MFFRKLKEIDPHWIMYALAGCTCVLFFACITHLHTILDFIKGFFNLFHPVLLGAIIAYVIYPLVNLMDRKVLKHIHNRSGRWVCAVILALILVFAFLSLLIASLIPQLISSIQSLIDNVGSYLDNMNEFSATLKSPFKDVFDHFVEQFSGQTDGQPGGKEGLFKKIRDLIINNLNQIITTTSSIGSGATNIGVGSIIAVYFLFTMHSIGKTVRRFMKLLLRPKAYNRTVVLVHRFNEIFSKYISCELVDAMIIGCSNFLFMLLFKMPNALVISVLVGVTNLAPTFGPIVGGALAAFILFLVDPGCVIPFLIFTVLIQSMDSYFIKPKLFGGALNVPGVLILIAIIVFGRLWGVVGMLVAIPIAAIIVYLYSEMLIPWLEERYPERMMEEE